MEKGHSEWRIPVFWEQIKKWGIFLTQRSFKVVLTLLEKEAPA